MLRLQHRTVVRLLRVADLIGIGDLAEAGRQVKGRSGQPEPVIPYRVVRSLTKPNNTIDRPLSSALKAFRADPGEPARTVRSQWSIPA